MKFASAKNSVCDWRLLTPACSQRYARRYIGGHRTDIPFGKQPSDKSKFEVLCGYPVWKAVSREADSQVVIQLTSSDNERFIVVATFKNHRENFRNRQSGRAEKWDSPCSRRRAFVPATVENK